MRAVTGEPAGEVRAAETPTQASDSELAHEWRRLQEEVRRRGGGYGNPNWRGYQSTGIEALDAVLPAGGLPIGAVTELLAAPGAGARRLAFELVSARLRTVADRPLLWIEASPRTRGTIPPTTEVGGTLYAPALAQAGVPLERLIHARPQTADDALWSAEQALIAGVTAMIVLEAAGLSTSAVRRLQLAAEESGSVLLLIRPVAEQGERSASPLRLRLSAVPLGSSDLASTATATPDGTAAATKEALEAYLVDREERPPILRSTVEVLRCRGGLPGGLIELATALDTFGDLPDDPDPTAPADAEAFGTAPQQTLASHAVASPEERSRVSPLSQFLASSRAASDPTHQASLPLGSPPAADYDVPPLPAPPTVAALVEAARTATRRPAVRLRRTAVLRRRALGASVQRRA